MSTEQTDAIVAQLAEQSVETVWLQYVDIGGQVKGISLPAQRFAAICTVGQAIDGSSLDSVVRLRESDMVLRPDPETFVVLPWTDGEHVARVICDVTMFNGRPFAGDPRQILRRAIQFAAEMGYAYHVAPEIEFFVCERDGQGHLHPLSEDSDSYFDLSLSRGVQLRQLIVKSLREMGIAVTSSQHEVAPGQHEIDLEPAPALAAADQLMTLKYVARYLAHQQGLSITFMPKPFNEMSGSGLHIHQYLAGMSSPANLFGEPGHRAVSELAHQFIAGQLQHAASSLALLCPLVNSYKRLVGGYEAPATIIWAHENRSAFIRVPAVAPEHPEQARVEVRGGDPSCNPYLALAALLRAGLAGVRDQSVAPQPVEDYVYAFEEHERLPLGSLKLPLSLGEALQTLSTSALMQETLGEHIFGRYLEMKRREWRAYQTHVSDWEQQSWWEHA
jgi:glutamine synthetase